jgi:hypothetical protein
MDNPPGPGRVLRILQLTLLGTSLEFRFLIPLPGKGPFYQLKSYIMGAEYVDRGEWYSTSSQY